MKQKKEHEQMQENATILNEADLTEIQKAIIYSELLNRKEY
jgi:hypothetical protein